MANASVYFSSRQFRSFKLCVVKWLSLKLTIFRERRKSKLKLFKMESANYIYLDIIPNAFIHPFHNSLGLHIRKNILEENEVVEKEIKM